MLEKISAFRMRLDTLRMAIAAGAMCTAFGASAATLEVGVGGGSDCTFSCVDRYQQLYDASIFSNPVTITAVSFFASTDGGLDDTWNGVSTWQMSLSTTSTSLGGMSATFDDNVGGDVIVFDTATFLGSVANGEATTFTGSFAYDPSMGNLLIDIIRTIGTAEGVGLDAGLNSGLFDRAYAFNSTTTADGFNDDGYALVTRFDFEQQSVSEPATLALLGLGLLGIGFARRRGKLWER